jgi:hypothetical protein
MLKTRGPLFLCTSQVQAAEVNDLIAAAVAQVHPVDTRTWTAPSPWHAVTWLRNVAAGILDKVPVWPPPGDQEIVFDKALLFRGQRDATWEVAPSLFRQARTSAIKADGFKHDEYDAKLKELFESLARFNLAMKWLSGDKSDNLHIATAQHYGLATYLLDLTIDPCIAGWFACDGAKKDDLAAIYWMPHDSESLDLPIIIAPPWVRRLHRQRGLFVNCLTSIEVLAKHSPWHRIVFPADPAYCDVFKDRVRLIYPEDPWFEAAVRWARESRHPVKDPSEDTQRSLARELEENAGERPFEHEGMVVNVWQDWLNLFVLMMEWLALRVDGAEKLQVRLACEPIRAIAAYNPSVYREFRQATAIVRKMGVEVQDSGLGRHVEEILACLEPREAAPE